VLEVMSEFYILTLIIDKIIIKMDNLCQEASSKAFEGMASLP
jgi:hypothetical protein